MNINKKGFTLIELLAVIVILAILVAAAVPTISSYLVTAKKKSYVTNTNAMIDAIRKDIALKQVEEDTEYYYQLDTINELMSTKLITSPFGNAYSKTSYAKVVVDSEKNKTFAACLSDTENRLCQVQGSLEPENVIESEEDCVPSSNGNEIFAKYNTDSKTITFDGEEYSAGSLAFNGTHNVPKITDNMYPVKWNGTSWVVTTTSDNDWYTYHKDEDIDNSGDTNKDDGEGSFTLDKWANAHITTDVLSEGETINETDLNLYVWIPRYTYLLDEPSKTIAIKYSNSTTDNNSDNYLSHPGFTFGDEEVTGIWVAKFEMSANTTSDDYGTPSGDAIAMSAPNKNPWRNISVNDIFNEARSMETEYEVNADSHMIKSSEWAAVIYLTEAIRDGEEVWINNQGNDSYKCLTTGCVSSTTKSAEINNATTAVCPSGYDYKTGGVKASTTGNEYGIYDMSGGAGEYVATYINDDTYSRLTSSSHALSLASSESKYKEMIDVYGSSGTNNYNNSESLTTGLALHETSTSGSGTSSWHNDLSYYPYTSFPILLRGGRFNDSSYAGLFAFYRYLGGSTFTYGWRVVWLL